MCMSLLERRVQLLLDPRQYEQVEREARRTGQSVAAVIREAIADRVDRGQSARAAAAERLLARPADDTPEPDWPEIKAAMEDEFASRYP